MAYPKSTTRIVGDIMDIIAHMKKNHVPSKKELSFDENDKVVTERVRHYNRFTSIERGESYYRIVTVCKLLYHDLVNGSNMHKLAHYVDGIDTINPESIKKIFYDNESEEYVIKTEDKDYFIYKGNISYIYSFFCDVPDSIEYDMVYDDTSVYATAKHNEMIKIPVFSENKENVKCYSR